MPSYSRKVEALAEAITKTSGYHNPDSALHAARNPGSIKAFTPDQHQDASGNRVFLSFLDGYQSLLHDLTIKVSGKSRSGLRPDSPLKDLARARQEPETTARSWSLFLRAAVSDPNISPTTPLSYFTE